MLLIDTSVLIEYFRKTKKEETFFYLLAAAHTEFGISAITKYEIMVGSNALQEEFWKQLFSTVTTIDFDEKIALEAALIKKELKSQGNIIGFEDIAIGATARANNYALATLNEKHFTKIANLKLVTQ